MTNSAVRYHDTETKDMLRSGYGGPGWYFWDEAGMYCYGPWPTEGKAEGGMQRYADHLNEVMKPSWWNKASREKLLDYLVKRGHRCWELEPMGALRCKVGALENECTFRHPEYPEIKCAKYSGHHSHLCARETSPNVLLEWNPYPSQWERL